MTIFKLNKWIFSVFCIALTLLLPLWNIPHTMALRSLFSLILLLIVIIAKPDWRLFFKYHVTLLLVFLYIVLQLAFFSTDYVLAFHNFKSEWLKFILFALAGIGSGYILGYQTWPRLNLYLGILFTTPLLVHLVVSLIEGISIGRIPTRFWGINETHGDLAYTSIHVTILLSVYLLFQAKSLWDKTTSCFLLGASVLSLLIASSRGGLAFILASFLTVLLMWFLKKGRAQYSLKSLFLAILALTLTISSLFYVGAKLDPDPDRWKNTFTRVEMGFKGDALKINCEGIEVLENTLQQNGIEITPSLTNTLDSIKNGDGSRIMAARSALHLIPEHLMGINQSRLGYDIALEQACGHTPKIELSNAHNGWLDTALAIGIVGAILYFLVCCNFIKLGIQTSFGIYTEIIPYGVALFSLSFIWIIRSIFDSAQRDQMLEMQIFTMCLMSSLILFKTQAKKITPD